MLPHHRIISCDDHLDLNMLPAELWIERLPEAFRDRAPRVTEHEGRSVWVCEGKVWGSWSGANSGVRGPKPIFTALDRGGIVDQTQRRPGVAELRLEDMDRDGVYAHVIFGPVTSIVVEDPELRDACYSAYNDWLGDFCAAAPDRLLGVPMLPPVAEAAVKELARLAKRGDVKQANLQIATVEPKISDPRWEPLFELLEQTGIILSFHVTVFASAAAAFDPLKGSPGATFLHAKSFVEQFLDPFVDLFAYSILERHPGLKIVIAESGVGWVPWVVEELDYRHWRLWEAAAYWADKGGIPHHKEKPSTLFKRQIYGTFQQSPTAMSLLKFWGPNNLLWATDYPHPDSIWPNSRHVIAETMGDLPEDVRRAITYGNAAKLYGLPPDEMAAGRTAHVA
ncbi:MAG TPA: amidohydrolase family protein [Steroidobacteraceae bacterium]|jgi:predicted TIM-barrel fold metal-dependent hydrolase|nr:amidohydrolase family protein [Steroidobacteraceae bacterium]